MTKTVRIELNLPASASHMDVCAAIRGLGYRLRLDPDGTIRGYPISPERHGNATVYHFPRHRGQRAGQLPGPEAA